MLLFLPDIEDGEEEEDEEEKSLLLVLSESSPNISRSIYAARLHINTLSSHNRWCEIVRWVLYTGKNKE